MVHFHPLSIAILRYQRVPHRDLQKWQALHGFPISEALCWNDVFFNNGSVTYMVRDWTCRRKNIGIIRMYQDLPGSIRFLFTILRTNATNTQQIVDSTEWIVQTNPWTPLVIDQLWGRPWVRLEIVVLHQKCWGMLGFFMIFHDFSICWEMLGRQSAYLPGR